MTEGEATRPRAHRHVSGRWARRLAILSIGLIAGVLVGAGVASAHNVLTGSDPVNGASVDTAPTRVSLTFDQPIQNLDPVLLVTGPNGNVFTDGPPTIDGNVISAPLGPAGPAGLYRAAYRIVSADGHPVTGEITYTLTAKAAGTATGSQPPAGATPNSAAGSSSGLGGWLWLGLGVAAVLVVIAVAIALRKPREPQGPRP
jgi:methionine-rich copper-binding protein CopC